LWRRCVAEEGPEAPCRAPRRPPPPRPSPRCPAASPDSASPRALCAASGLDAYGVGMLGTLERRVGPHPLPRHARGGHAAPAGAWPTILRDSHPPRPLLPTGACPAPMRGGTRQWRCPTHCVAADPRSYSRRRWRRRRPSSEPRASPSGACPTWRCRTWSATRQACCAWSTARIWPASWARPSPRLGTTGRPAPPARAPSAPPPPRHPAPPAAAASGEPVPSESQACSLWALHGHCHSVGAGGMLREGKGEANGGGRRAEGEGGGAASKRESPRMG